MLISRNHFLILTPEYYDLPLTSSQLESFFFHCFQINRPFNLWLSKWCKIKQWNFSMQHIIFPCNISCLHAAFSYFHSTFHIFMQRFHIFMQHFQIFIQKCFFFMQLSSLMLFCIWSVKYITSQLYMNLCTYRASTKRLCNTKFAYLAMNDLKDTNRYKRNIC